MKTPALSTAGDPVVHVFPRPFTHPGPQFPFLLTHGQFSTQTSSPVAWELPDLGI
jgi:hypothetical protein